MTPDDLPTPEEFEEYVKELEAAMEQIGQSIRQESMSQESMSETRDGMIALVNRDIDKLVEINHFDHIGTYASSKPCCLNSDINDVVAIFIHGEDTQKKIDNHDPEVKWMMPNFRPVIFVCYDLHRMNRALIVQDMESAKLIHNALGTAIQKLTEREGPDPLDRLLQ